MQQTPASSTRRKEQRARDVGSARMIVTSRIVFRDDPQNFHLNGNGYDTIIPRRISQTEYTLGRAYYEYMTRIHSTLLLALAILV